MNRPDYILDIPADEYHRATKENQYTSSHRLNMFRRCPALYHKHVTGEIVEEDTPAFQLGRATHTLIIEGPEAFEREYAVSDGPTNPKTGAPYGKTTKAYLEWAAEQPLPVVATEDHATIMKMRDAVLGHEKAAEILSAGFAEGSVRAVWDGESVQARMDWFDPERGVLADLKTCADIDRFAFDIRDFGYVHQLAFYERILHLAGYDKPVTPWIVAVEKREPYRVAVYQITAATVEEANEATTAGKLGIGNGPTIRELRTCRETDVWPTRYEGYGLL